MENGIYLRLPGQWQDEVWSEATSGAGVYHNVHRWYVPGLGLYTRSDPLGVLAEQGISTAPYVFARGNPVRFVDPLGLYTAQGNPRFKREVADAMRRIRDGLDDQDAECCTQYFEDRGIDIEQWLEPGGPPYIREGRSEEFRTASGAKACGKPQTGPPFSYMWVNWEDCFRTPDPCLLSSTILHEIGHLARQDTDVDNEPSDFFKPCTLDGCTQPGVRGD